MNGSWFGLWMLRMRMSGWKKKTWNSGFGLRKLRFLTWS